MRSIYKYPLQTHSAAVIRAEGFKPLDVQLQNGVITLWAEVSTAAIVGECDNVVVLVGTGWTVPPRSAYFATVQLPDGTVWHAYHVGVA